MGDTVAVLQPDGLWLLRPGSNPQLVVRATGLRAIVAAVDGASASRFLVAQVQTDPTTKCRTPLRLVDVAAGPKASAESFPTCADDGPLVRLGQIRGERILDTTIPANGGQHVATRIKVSSLDGKHSSFITPATVAGEPTFARFDPAWVSDSVIVYVRRPSR